MREQMILEATFRWWSEHQQQGASVSTAGWPYARAALTKVTLGHYAAAYRSARAAAEVNSEWDGLQTMVFYLATAAATRLGVREDELTDWLER